MFNLSIVTPEQIFYDGEIYSLIAPGIEGYLGVLTDHAPLITAVTPGKVTVQDKDRKELTMSVTYGFLEVSGNHATLLVDAAEFASDIDADRAREAFKRARQRLADKVGSIDLPRARQAVERARNRLRISSSFDHTS